MKKFLIKKTSLINVIKTSKKNKLEQILIKKDKINKKLMAFGKRKNY